jgi:Asp/Glu/hydantoin racemase
MKIMDDLAAECIAAVDENRADSVILSCEHLQAMADGIRQRLDDKGYGEIPIIRTLPAGIEMALAMANMKLLQTARAYPGHNLKLAPRFC